MKRIAIFSMLKVLEECCIMACSCPSPPNWLRRALFPSPLAVNPFSHSRLDINAIRVHSPAKKEEGRNFAPHCANVKDNFAPQAKNSRLPLLFMLSHFIMCVCTVESPSGSCVNPAQESRSPSAKSMYLLHFSVA